MHDIVQTPNLEKRLTPEEYQELVNLLYWIINETLYPDRVLH